MSEAMTFTTLKEDLQRYLERGNSAATDPTVFEQLPRLINLAERRIATELKVQGLINVVTTALTVGQSVYAKPDRWKDTVSINIGTGTGNATRTFLLPRSYEYARSYWPDEAQTGTPVFYADYNYNNWLVLPTPDAAYPMEILYYHTPPLLDTTTQTNWLTDEMPQLLLYGALLEATPFLKNDSRIATWREMYDRAAQALTGEDLSKILDRAAQRGEA